MLVAVKPVSVEKSRNSFVKRLSLEIQRRKFHKSMALICHQTQSGLDVVPLENIKTTIQIIRIVERNYFLDTWRLLQELCRQALDCNTRVIVTLLLINNMSYIRFIYLITLLCLRFGP